jgi:hypothetical protein
MICPCGASLGRYVLNTPSLIVLMGSRVLKGFCFLIFGEIVGFIQKERGASFGEKVGIGKQSF